MQQQEIELVLHHTRWETRTRWYEAWIGVDLFGDVVLVRHWGGKDNRRHGQKTVLCADLTEALKKLDALQKRRKNRPNPYAKVSEITPKAK